MQVHNHSLAKQGYMGEKVSKHAEMFTSSRKHMPRCFTGIFAAATDKSGAACPPLPTSVGYSPFLYAIRR